jgi:hypothetical protein
MQSYDIISESYTATSAFQAIMAGYDNRQYLAVFAILGDTQICFDEPTHYSSFTLYEGSSIDFAVPTNKAIYIAGNSSRIIVLTNKADGTPPPPARIYLTYNSIATTYNAVPLWY